MSYWLSEFDGLTLPTQEPEIEVGTGGVQSVLLSLPAGGVFDPLGGSQAMREGEPVRGRFLLSASSASGLKTAFEALRAKIGVRGALYREWDDGTLEWTYARLEEIRARQQTGQITNIPVDLRFIKQALAWYGATEQDVTYADLSAASGDADLPTTGAEQDGYPLAFTLTNEGNYDQRAVMFTLTAGGGNITAVTLANSTSGHTLTWSGTLVAGKSLVIDCGALSIQNDGTDDYDSLTPPSGKETWMVLGPGANVFSLNVTEAGGGSGLQVEFYDAYA